SIWYLVCLLLITELAPRNDKIVYRITYKVYRLNTVASRKLFQGWSRGRIPLEYLVGKTR
ncbi:MAG: hypothetical protein KBI07_06845, partial [Candidatus Atribacteria bacterium]|nr:hypothetical protein [Candidatus Atribacteria bacterium]